MRSPQAQKCLDEGERLASAGMEAYQAKDTVNSARLAREAFASFRRALDLEPEDPAILNALGVQHVNLGEPEQALALCEKAVRIARDRKDQASLVEGLVNLGFILPGLGRQEEGVRACQEALRLEPGNEAALHLMRAHSV